MDARWIVFLAVAAVVAAAGIAMQRRKHARVRRERGSLFDDVVDLFHDVAVTQDDVDFPVLTGERDGYLWRLEPVVDALTYRKLPSLWLCITCYAPLDVSAPASVLLRPTGNEFFSPNRRYDHELALPEGCPVHARAASADGTDVSFGAVGGLLPERETKEIVVSRRGLRVVRQVGEADAGRYRVGRRIDLGAPVLDSDALRRICALMVESVRPLDRRTEAVS